MPTDWNMRIGRLFLEQQGLGEVVEEIHPADAMYQTIAHGADMRPECGRFTYFRSGYEALLALENVLRCTDKPLSSRQRVLEFACGYGRVTRHLVGVVSSDQIYCSDIVEDAVRFVRDTFGVNGFVSSTQPEQLVMKDSFDVIFVSSLFSHLPWNRFVDWLRVLYNALTPDGVLVFSTHGYGICHDIKKCGSGYTFVSRSESNVLDSSEYGTSYVRPDAVKLLADSAGVAQLYAKERELWQFQDLYVASRSALTGLEEWPRTSVIDGRVDIFHQLDNSFYVSGWAADRAGGAPLADIRLSCLDIEARAEVGFLRSDVAEIRKRPDYERSGWQLEGRWAGLHQDAVLLAFARSSSGVEMCFDAKVVADNRSNDLESLRNCYQQLRIETEQLKAEIEKLKANRRRPYAGSFAGAVRRFLRRA